MTANNNTDWRANVKAMMTDPNFAARVTTAVDKPTSQPLDLSRVEQMQTEDAARATMPDDDSGVADLAVQAYADARKQIGDEVSKQMADDKSMAFVHPVTAGILRSAKSMEAGDVQKTFDRMLENSAVRQAIETKANKELTAALGKNPALTEEQQKDIYNKSVQRQIDAISGRVNQYLLDVNAPKSESEYVLKSAVGNSLIGKSMLQAARNISGLESAEYDYAQQALADYDANKASWYGKGGAAIGSLLLDAPMMQGIGSASSAVLGRGTSMALGKAASNTLWGKMLIGQATAAGTLGGYNFTSTLASQMMGGHFDAGELFGSTLHGVGLGALTGGMTPLLRGATTGMGAVGKTATMGGGILGEAAAFSAPEWVETFSENPYDFKAYAEALGTNVMVIAGLKASNLPKTVQEYKEWWNQGKTSNFTDADYKALSDYALAKGYANDGAFTYQDGVYQRSMADRATGGRNILTMTKLEGGKERNLAMEMYQDPNVPLSMKTKIAAKMGLPAPNPVLPNAVEARDNVVNTYYEYREQMSDGTYVTRRILVDSKEMPSKRKARAAASEFGRTKARQNSIIQSEAEANTDATNAIVMARLTEQAWRSGTNVSDEVARMYDIAQRTQRGEASAEDIAYYQSVMEGTTEVTDRIKADIKDKTGVDIDEVLKQEGTFNTAQDKALTMYSEALASLKDSSKPTTERGTTASQASIADYIELKGMGIEQTKQLLNDPTAKVAAEKEIRNKYSLWLKYFDGQMSEEQLASRLGYNLDSTKGLMDFVNEEAFFRGKAANRIAYNAANAAKRLLEQGSGGVRFTEDGKVKLQGVPYSIAVDESIVDRYRAAQQGSGENYQRIANDALKDIIRQSEQPIEEMLQQMATEEQAIANEPQTEQEAVTQQMVDNRLAEIDTDLQGIEADGIQRVNINDKPAMIVKGRIAYISNGEIDRANSSAEVAYIPLDENGRPIKNEQGKPVVEVGVKPSNVRISEVEPWHTIEDYKRAEEQRIRDNNRITDEAMAQVDAEDGEVKEELPTLDKAPIEPKDADELIAMCDGDKALALDVAVDELAKAQAAKGKGASTAETIDINRRIRTYQQIVDRLSSAEMPDAAAAEVESEQKGEATKAEPQVTDDMEFVYQQGLDESHEGMEPMQMSDGRYKWVGLQRGELTATMGERDVELLDGLAKKLGVAVIPISVADSAVNGYYRDGNVYVNTNRGADWTMRWVAGHEMLHDVAKKSPEAYNAYKQAVLDMWGSDYINDQVKQIIDDYAASGKTIDREQALTELVNDFGGELFNSRDGLSILDDILKSESRKGNTGFVNTIKQWWERLKEWFGGTPYASEVEKKLADAYKEAIANAEKFGKNYDFDYSIIGKRGAENLDKVEEATIRLDNLAVAREMESSGKDAKTIRMATGWERGADNKWRYEIPDELDLTDGEMILNIAIDKAKWKRAAEKLGTTAESLKSENDNLKAEVERRRMISTIEQMLADNESTNDLYVRELKKSTLLKKLNFYKTGLKYKDSDDVEKMWADLKDSIDKVDVLKLSEVMGADNAIFKAYPELADIDVRFDAKGNTSVLATVSNDGKEIWINPHNIESQSSVFLHEIQHLIQKIEGFARGGSSRMFDIPEEHKFANMPGSVIKSMREQAEFARKKLSEYSTIEEIKEYYKANRSWLTSSEKDAVISVMDALMYGESVEDAVSSLEKDYQQAIDDLNWSLTSKDSPYSKYTRLGGEVESRNVQNRMNMTDEERRNTLLSETEDVAREDQILLFDNLGESQMGGRVDKRMAEIGSYFSERELNDNERAAVDVFGGKSDKQKQFDIISSTNPMRDDYHTGIRKVDDILTLQEAIEASKQENGEGIISTYPDVDESVYNEALQSGKIKVYSSKPIENGAFVGPSMMQAKDYAGGGKVYSKEVNVSDIAWINADEGVYANLGKRADESVLDYAKRMSEENADADYSIKIRGKEYRNDGYTQREGVNLSIGANEALKSGMTDIGMDGLFGDFIAESGLGKFDGEYHHVGQKFNKHYFAKLNDGVTLASARKAYKKYLEDKSNKEVADVLKKYPDAIPMDGGIYRDYKEVAYAGGKFWFVPRGENEPRPTFYKDLPKGEDADYTTYFSVKANNELDKKSLVGIHNLTEDNLRYALNLGGLANPSTAVIDTNIMGLEGFGDISLIMPKSLVAKSTGKNAGTFAGDAYTPRFPRGSVVKYMTRDGEKAVMKDYPGKDKFSQDFRSAIYSLGDEYGGITPALYYMYKLENGGAKIVKAEAPKIKSKEHQRMIDKFGNKEWYELNDAEKRELVDYRKSEMIESLKGADKNMVDKVINDFINSADPEDLAYKKLRMLKMDYKEQQRAGEIDYMATYRNAQDDVALAGEQAKFNKWLADKSKRYGIEDRIFRGYTASGNRKYAPMTLVNISKVMKEQGRAGAETFMTKSAYSLRGKMLPVYKTLEQIKKNKSKLTDTETYEKFRKEIGDEYNELILDISELPNAKYDDTHYILEDALLKGFDYAEKQAGIQISKAVRERISAFGNLLKEAPVKYFETKFERPVTFDEFVAAVVPKDINPELRKALTDNGLAVEEYDRGDEASRLEAIRKASDRDDVQFSVKGKRADESVLDYAKRMSEETGKKNLLNGGSYFSGGGLLEEGLKGIVNPTIAVEFNQKVAGVYRNNFGEHIVTADVRDVDPAELVKDIDGPVAYFHASPVCKNFSNAKRNAEELPLDKETAQSTAKFIGEVRPKIVTIENVKGYRGSDAMKIILDELKKQGYNYDVDVYNAADYGAYTSRERLIVRAVRDWPLPPKPIKMLADERPSGWFEAVADIIDELPQAKNGVADWMDTRLKAMGIDYRNIDRPLYIFGSGYAKDKIGHAFADELVPTLRTKGGDIIVMPDGRVLKATPRVLARISGMSDDYTMPKSDDLAHTVVGNGIPVQLTKAVMGSLIENVKSDLDSGATEYSIIGKRGAANLDRRDESGIRADNLVTAEDMEKAGKDAKIIRMATGWERGADGKWRYEIADAKLLPWEVWSKKRAPKLKDIVENADELFAAYPELKDVKVKKGRKGVSGGSYGNNVITLNSGIMEFLEKYGTADDVLSGNKEINNTLIHEIQHYIQDAEGFAQGGDKSTIIDSKLREEVSSLIDEINDDVDIYNSLSSSDPIKQMLRYTIEDKRAELVRLKRGSQLGYDGYKRLAGEVEARNAEKRLGMAEEERKNSLLADTEDVGRDEQIVYGNTEDVQFSIKGGRSLEDRLNSKRMQTRLNAAKELSKDYPEVQNILDDLEPGDINEVVAATLGSPDFKLRWEDKTGSKGLQKHLGLSDAEKKGFRSMISSNGYTPEEAAHQIWRTLPEEIANTTDDMEILNKVLDYAANYTKRELRDMIANNRIEKAIDYAKKQEEWDAAQEEIYLDTLSEQERNDYLANKAEQKRVANMTDKQRAQYYRELQIKQMLDAMTPEERAEYEAKEQWRKDNAGAIASSFFAERRADKAAEVERLKKKISELKADNTKAASEDKAKVREIADEMHAYIKKNIPTENQGDMTRQQFESVLKQLETAVTKQDLEKPMQMVEYIGTNVTRRSLTRQMRTFLKSEFKSMTPQGAVKAKTVDGATSRVLELAKTMYATMNKLPLGGEVAALQKQMRDLKADATEWAKDQNVDTQNLLADVLKVTERPAATRYNELAELRNKVAADGSASGEMLGYIDHMLDIMGDIDYFRGEQQKAKEASALNSKEDLEALKSELLDKSDKGILSEEDKAVLDNMPLYEMMVNLRQQQLDIDGGGAASIDAQIRNKQNAIKTYRAKMNELPKTDTTGRERYKKLIEQVEGEIDDLFASRIVDQKAVNNGMRELIDDLVTLKEQGHSRLVEWSKGKQERSNGIRKLANDSFSSTARGYWDEVNKKGHRLRDINNFLNNAKLTVISPALSFEYMLGTLDKKYYTNDSPIYNRFIKSQDGLLKANDTFFEGLEAYNKEVNAAANRLIGRNAITNMAEWFKKGDRFATEEIPFAFEVDQMFDDGKVRKVTKGITATMTRGQAAKIYAWSRMVDGMAKLKAHGVTDETLAAVKDFIGEGYMRFVDWVEDDFFPRLRREKYNPKYKEIYGISMAENEHYFPFAIYKKDVRTNTDLEQIGDDKLGGGLVGNLIERKRNNARLDFTRKSPDIFDMITRYGETMEEWTAYAQVREDLKAMVNDKQFKVKCDMFGTDYYKHFLEAARVASRTSDDKALAGKWNTSMSKLQKVLASGAISMRVSTALKQLLSAPAFAVYSLDPKFLHQLEKTVVPIDVESAIKGLFKIGSGDLAEAKKLLLNENWVGHYNWCVNNLPSFRERVSLGGAGNPILEEKGFSKLCDAVQSLGMIPNRLVDAFTCSMGAKAVYEYNFNKYKKMYGEKTAHNMAVTEAEIAFNSSQQSSNPVFLSPMQVSKQFLLRGLMNFKNSPIGYLRAGLKANTDIVRAIKSIYNPTFKVDGQEMRFNSNGKNANSMLMTAAARSAMYNFFLNFIWNFGVYGIAGLSYTAKRNLFGEGDEDGNLLYSDEEWKKATGDNWASTLFLCATQGLPYISGPFTTAEQGTEFAPLMLFNTLNEMGTDIYQHGLVSPVTAQWITNLALKNGAGIDPQVCAQVYEGLQGILADRPVTEEDIMNLLASPRSAISGMTKQKVGEFDRLRDYVDARIKSNREIGIDERMDFGKALAGKRELRKSNLDYYIDEYLEANIPGYREISGRKSKETKQEEQANKKLYEQSMSLVEKIVSTPKGEADEQKSSKIDSEDEDIKYMVRRLRDAVAAIHKLYAAGDYSTAEDIAAEMQRRIERGYDPNGKTLDERLKNVDIWEPVGEVKQDSPDGYYTNFDRAIGGEFKKMYVGKMNGEGN